MDLGDLFKDLAWDAIVKAALARLFAAVPLLGWGPIGYIITWVVTEYSDALYQELDTWVDMKVLAFKNEEFRKKFVNTQVKLKIIALDKGIESKEFKDAREKDKQALSDLVNRRPAA